jgi:hypothetical protein
MAYFTDPMGDEFRKALQEAMKEGTKLEDPDADVRSSRKSGRRRTADKRKNSADKENGKKRISKRTSKKPLLSRKLAEELR